MALEQEVRFVLNLSLAESYIYGTATTIDGRSYSINIQQATDQLVVLPSDFCDVRGESSQASVSFGRYEDYDDDNNNKIIIISKIQIGQGDLIEVYLNEDNILLALANKLPVEMALKTDT
jgi:hypothetical protein